MSISGIEQTSGSLQEMMAMMQGTGANQTQSATGGKEGGSIEDMFEEFDQDGSGDLSEDEITAMQEKMQQGQAMMAMMQDVGMSMDSGQSSTAVGEDAASGGGDPLASLMESLASEESFDVMDTDEDGVVSSAEFAEYMSSGDSDTTTTTASSEETDIKKNLMQQAISAYQQRAQESDLALDLIG